MKKGVQLPDYLPSRYRSWYDLYLDILRGAEQRKLELTDDSIINLEEYGFEEHKLNELYKDTYFYQEWPLIVIKSRALDAVIAQLPTFEEVLDAKYQTRYGLHTTQDFFSKLLNVCPKKR